MLKIKIIHSFNEKITLILEKTFKLIIINKIHTYSLIRKIISIGKNNFEAINRTIFKLRINIIKIIMEDFR